MKHIEQILPEYAAFELDRIGREETDATASAALTALLHNVTGCAIPPLATTPQSEVEELVPLCLSILRRHWTTPLTALGDGTTPMSLADLMRRLIGDRVQGNEAWSIPAIHADIPTAVAALLQRDMSSGLTLTLTDGTDGSTPTTMPLPDGLSLAQLLCSGLADNITELQDSNKGWDYCIIRNLTNIYPKLNKVKLNCKRFGGLPYQYQVWFPSNPESIQMDELERFEGEAYIGFPSTNPNYKIWSFPKLKYSRMSFSHSYNSLDDYVNDWTEVVYMPEMVEFGGYASNICLCNFTALHTLILGLPYKNGLWLQGDTNLVHLEFTKTVASSFSLSSWSPTTALSERLPEFLSNFKTYIAHRLTDNGSGLTLTLSQAVRDAIQTDPEIVSIITSKGWTISPAPSV